MEKILSVYGYGIIQNLTGLLQTLEKEGFSVRDFLDYAEKASKNKIKERKVVNKQPKLSKPKQLRTKIKSVSFLKSGETELMQGVRCENCHGEVYIEAICPKNPLVKKGYVRRGICGTCGNEFGIR